MALLLFGWVVTPPVSCHQRTINLQIYSFLRNVLSFFLFGLYISVAPILQGHASLFKHRGHVSLFKYRFSQLN